MEAESPDRDVARLELEKACSRLGYTLGKIVPPGTGFILAMFDFGDDGNMAYISNAERDGMLKLLTELLTKLKTATQ